MLRKRRGKRRVKCIFASLMKHQKKNIFFKKFTTIKGEQKSIKTKQGSPGTFVQYILFREQLRQSSIMPSRDDDGVFDTNFLFDSLEPDYGSIDKRNATERLREAAAAAAALEKENARIHAEEARRREEARQNEEFAARETARRNAERARQERFAKMREADLVFLPELLARIKNDEQSLNGPPPSLQSKWTLPDIRLSREDIKEMRRTLVAPTARLPDPIPFEKEPDDDDCDSAFDCYMRNTKGLHIERMISKHADKMDSVPILFETANGVSHCRAGQQYGELCHTFKDALDKGLYAFDGNLKNNLANAHVKRIRTYYEYATWGRYKYVDIVDGWTKMFQLALVIEPENVEEFFPAICKIINSYNDTVQEIKNFNRNSLRDTGSSTADEYRIRDFLRQTEEALSKYSIPGSLEASLMKRFEAIRPLLWARNESPAVKEMRRITTEVIKECARYFAENPKLRDVILLRNVAFGHKAINFRDARFVWVEAIRDLPYETLDANSKLRADCYRLRMQ